MLKKPPFSALSLLCLLLVILEGFLTATAASSKFKDVEGPFVVTKDQRQTVTQTEYGQISAVETSDGIRGTYHLQFITLEPNSLFLPILLHADMVFYVHTGSGSLSWFDEDDNKDRNRIDVQRGDIYRIPSGSVLYMRSSLESEREKLRIHAIFTTHGNTNENPQTLFSGAYSTLSDLVLGFDKKVLQAAFKVPEEVLDEITRSTKPPAIVHLESKSEKDSADWRTGIIETLIGTSSYDLMNKKKKIKPFNILNRKPDLKNYNGWSLAVNNKDFKVLKGSDIGVFMVNLTQGSMMGPHWNPRAGEISVVTHGQGMIRVVCPSSTTNETSKGCMNMSFKVKEGDIFVVPRFHPMAQMSYNNDTLVFMGFTTQARRNHPQFLAGKSSVLQTLKKDVLALSFNVPNTTIDELLGSQVDSIILECLSCAEEEERIMQEEIAREREKEEERKREEEERRRREEEEKAREREREREEEEARRREEARRQQEEAKRRQEEEARREEEEARRQEQERQAREEEEEKAREREREEEEARRREEARRQQEEAKRRQEEEARREEEEARRQEQERQAREEESRREEERRQQEEAKKRQEEAAKREEEAARRQEEERQARERQEEEERRRREEAGRREEEEREGREEEEAKREEEARRAEEEEVRREEEEQQQREREEEEAKREEEARREEEEQQQRQREEEEAKREEEARRAEEEAARREEEERQQQREREEEARRAEEEEEREREQEARRREEEEEARRVEEERQRQQQREREEEGTGREEETRREEEREERGGGGGKGRRLLKKT